MGGGPHALTLLLRLHDELLNGGNADADLTSVDLLRRDYWCAPGTTGATGLVKLVLT